jgi:hypothetical protein
METPMPRECFACGGELSVLGALGSKVWFRCIACGADQHADDPGQAESLEVL